jgi:dTMP kinase
MAMGEEHVRVQRLLTRMAAAEPHRYVVVDADSSPDVVAERVREGLRPLVGQLGRKAARRR